MVVLVLLICVEVALVYVCGVDVAPRVEVTTGGNGDSHSMNGMCQCE